MKKNRFFLLQLFLPVFCSISLIQGTKSQTSFQLGVYQPAELKVDAGTDVSIDVGKNTILGGSPTASGGTGNLAYLWLPSEYLNDKTLSNPTAQPPGNVTFNVKVSDERGCTAVDHILVTV
ncbi:MAG TPA: PKD domain-containing protein, partial [Bacteroidales bacterium]|nr:PKD domain-containing protein [Bacteroidales bacterium]